MKSLKRYDYLIYTFIFVVISVIWSQLSNFTWDDDAITRLMNVQDARHNSLQWLSAWNRPLFVVLFYLPIQAFGKTGAMLLMVALTAISGILLYKGLRHKGVPHASVAVVFLLFQTFLFGIARDAMTEPLASFLICLGLYCFYTEKFQWFALIGGLLPLARSEGILLMPFWLYPLLQRRLYHYIPLMAAGMLAWALGWYAYSGRPLALMQELLSSGNSKNRYAHVSLTHHSGKYVYVLGPVAFFFFLWGYLGSLRKMLSDYFVLLQFTVGFLVYVIFAVYMDLGQSGGALRNLITLSPLAAVICLYGFNYWMALWPLPAADTKTAKRKSTQPVTPVKRDELWVYVVFIILLAWISFTNELVYRQNYDPNKKDYTILWFLIVCCLLAILPVFSFARKRVYVVAGMLLVWQLTFTLWYENPQSHGNEERKGINDMTAFIHNSSLKDRKIFCGHPWYFWATGRHPNDTITTGEVSVRSKPGMQPGQLVIWEGHYTGEHYTNTPLPVFLNDTTFAPVYVSQNKDKEAVAVLFVKLYPQTQYNDRFFTNLVKEFPQNDRIPYFKGIYERDRKKAAAVSIQDFNAALALNPGGADIYLARGISYLLMKDKANGCRDLNQAALMGSQQALPLLQSYCK
ncbi:hypothetical protein [Chitinophaga flava]|uniref:Glycosyltransferase RgtA/B/C/D-like domain-containing protein n=1 Tax=Chitinophaga flava TaxID=2259036 RepID=A0A365XWF6_9BACT|nr:hypothetical protein [Chitinophaga flava]RBL90418.1 hypothetical protein DF182_28575 [Chitinophaga flava]